MKKLSIILVLCVCLTVLTGCGTVLPSGPTETNASAMGKACPLDFTKLSFSIEKCLNDYGDRVVCCNISNNSPYKITRVEMHWIYDGSATEEVKERWKNAVLTVCGCSSFEELQKKDSDATEEKVDKLASNPAANTTIRDDIEPGCSGYDEICFWEGYKPIPDVSLMDDLVPDYMEVEFEDENGESHDATYDFLKGYVCKYD